MIIRVLLIGAVLVMALLALRNDSTTRRLAVRRVALIAFTIAWIVAVLSPNALTTLAVLVGVGRGTDLLLYALVVAVALSSIGVYKRFTTMDQRITDLTREVAFLTAERSVARGAVGPAASSEPVVGLRSVPDDDRARRSASS